MSVTVRCQRIYDKESLKAIIQSCGCYPPEDPRCPPLDSSPCGKSSEMNNGYCCSNKTSSPSLSPRNNMTYPPQPPCPPCLPSPFICPPCTGFACISCPPMPKSVPASNDSTGAIIRIPMVSGGLFYIGTSRIHPPKPACSPKPCFHSGKTF